MSIQQFTGSSMSQVLSQVREALGRDALILDSKELEDGIHVSAVAERDSHELAAALAEELPAKDAAAIPTELIEDQIAAQQAITAAAEKLTRISDVSLVRDEMRSIRSLVESHLAHVGWSETSLGSPVQASIMRNLSALGIAPDIVRLLVEQIDIGKTIGNAWAAPMNTLMQTLPFVTAVERSMSGIVAVVGPTGAGKTTTVAKLAARYAIEHSVDDLAIVSLDNHRLGASEQIDSFGRIIGLPILRPTGDRGLEDIADALTGKALVLIDTTGIGQHDPRLRQQLARLRVNDRTVRKLLALPANLEHDAMQETATAYQASGLFGAVLTKVDEAATLGAAFSVILRSRIPLAYVADGQRIPEDIHAAEGRKAWLVKHAIELMRARETTVSERYMAENFYGVRNQRQAEHDAI